MSAESERHIIVARHGILHNPSGLIYNRDSVMRPEDRMHLSEAGKTGTRELAEEIKSAGFKCVVIYTSPEIRAIESSEILAETLGITRTEIKDKLDDVLCPAPYLEKLTMKELERLGGDLYEMVQEKPADLAERMESVFRDLAETLHAGKTGIIVSHGDPIAWLLNKLIDHKLPEPKDLRGKLYLPKSGAMVFNLGENQTITSWKQLHNPRNSEIY